MTVFQTLSTVCDLGCLFLEHRSTAERLSEDFGTSCCLRDSEQSSLCCRFTSRCFDISGCLS